MPYKIDKGVKMPKDNKAKYPWKELDIGDSFFVPLTDCGFNSLRNQASSRGAPLGWVFKARAVTENGVEGTRVWRVA